MYRVEEGDVEAWPRPLGKVCRLWTAQEDIGDRNQHVLTYQAVYLGMDLCLPEGAAPFDLCKGVIFLPSHMPLILVPPRILVSNSHKGVINPSS